MAKPTRPAAVVAAEPAEEPLDPCSRFHGFRVPATVPVVPQCESAQGQLRHQDGARLFEATHHGRVFSDDLVPVRSGAPRSAVALGRQQILGAPRDAVKRAAVCAVRNLTIRPGRILERLITDQRYDGLQRRAVPFQPLHVERGEFGRTQLLSPNQLGELSDRHERQGPPGHLADSVRCAS